MKLKMQSTQENRVKETSYRVFLVFAIGTLIPVIVALFIILFSLTKLFYTSAQIETSDKLDNWHCYSDIPHSGECFETKRDGTVTTRNSAFCFVVEVQHESGLDFANEIYQECYSRAPFCSFELSKLIDDTDLKVVSDCQEIEKSVTVDNLCDDLLVKKRNKDGTLHVECYNKFHN